MEGDFEAIQAKEAVMGEHEEKSEVVIDLEALRADCTDSTLNWDESEPKVIDAKLEKVESNTKVKQMLNGTQETCPHCEESLIKCEIPDADRHHFIAEGEEDNGEPIYFFHTIAVSSLIFDRILAWKCPFCETIDVIPGMEEKWNEDVRYWAKHDSNMQAQLLLDAPEAA